MIKEDLRANVFMCGISAVDNRLPWHSLALYTIVHKNMARQKKTSADI